VDLYSYIYESFSIAEEVWCRFADSHFSLIPLHFSTSTVSPNTYILNVYIDYLPVCFPRILRAIKTHDRKWCAHSITAYDSSRAGTI